MPSFRFNISLAANGQSSAALVDWQYKYLPWPAQVTVLDRATTGDVVTVKTSGSETIVEESPVQGGGTDGVTPSPLNTPPDQWRAAAGDVLKLSYRETAGAVAIVDGMIEIEPLI